METRETYRVNRNDWVIKHRLPGRVRLFNPALRGDDNLAQGIADTVAKLPGVQDVNCNAGSGTVLVMFSEDQQSNESVIHAIYETHPASPKPANASAAGGTRKDDDNSMPVQVARALKHLAASVDSGVKDMSGGLIDLRQIVLAFLAGRVGVLAAESGVASFSAVESLVTWVVAWTLYEHPKAKEEVEKAEDYANPGP